MKVTNTNKKNTTERKNTTEEKSNNPYDFSKERVILDEIDYDMFLEGLRGVDFSTADITDEQLKSLIDIGNELKTLRNNVSESTVKNSVAINRKNEKYPEIYNNTSYTNNTNDGDGKQYFESRKVKKVKRYREESKERLMKAAKYIGLVEDFSELLKNREFRNYSHVYDLSKEIRNASNELSAINKQTIDIPQDVTDKFC